MTIQIAVLNQSTVVTDKDVVTLVAALQKQVDNDFVPAWGVPAKLTFYNKGKAPPAAAWWLGVFDDSDQAGALGYHDLTNEGLPFAKAFAKSDLDYKQSWTVTVSHELLEMLVDPNVNLTVFDQGPYGARLYAYEVCDACEADQFGYQIDSQLVSDFVLPSWFESFRAKGSTDFDFKKHIDAPLKLIDGGYIGINDIASGLGWNQINAEGAFNPRARAPQGSRRQRRQIPPDLRARSRVRF